MNVDNENERLGAAYRSSLKRYNESVAFWKEHPIAYTVVPGQPIPPTSFEVLMEADRRGTPDQTSHEAMVALNEWRGYRAAHDLP